MRPAQGKAFVLSPVRYLVGHAHPNGARHSYGRWSNHQAPAKLNAAHLTLHLRSQSFTHLQQHKPDELWLLADCSDLHKLYAKAMPHLLKIHSLTKTLIPGYRTHLVLGVTPRWCDGCLDSGFDAVAVWQSVWERNQHLICRLSVTSGTLRRVSACGWQMAGGNDW